MSDYADYHAQRRAAACRTYVPTVVETQLHFAVHAVYGADGMFLAAFATAEAAENFRAHTHA